MSDQITFITGNPKKAEQLSKYLGIPVAHHKLDLDEIQSLNLEEVIKHKVFEAYQKIQGPVIVDDNSLIIHALGKLPGPFIKFFLQELGSDGICRLISNYENKGAREQVAIGYYDGKNMEIFLGEVEGHISHTPMGENGFGWDNIFIPTGFDQTQAAMSEQDYDKTSPRRLALAKLEKFLAIINDF